MITKFKIYESENRDPEVGDYIYMNISEDYLGYFSKFINKSIGKVIETKWSRALSIIFLVEYDISELTRDEWFDIEQDYVDITGETPTVKDNRVQFWMYDDEIMMFSKNLEDVKIYIETRKYNL